MKKSEKVFLMIKPKDFGLCLEKTNESGVKILPGTFQSKGLSVFNTISDKLKKLGADVLILDPTKDSLYSLFPNQSITTHGDGTLIIYPLKDDKRSELCSEEIICFLEANNFIVENVIDYSSAEDEGLFLEGAGSLVLDLENEKSYVAISERSDEDIAIEFCEDLEYTPVFFNLSDANIHTDKVMLLTSKLAFVCGAAISDKKDRKMVMNSIKEDGRQILNLNQNQLSSFITSAVEVPVDNQKSFLLFSETAFRSLTKEQLAIVEDYHQIETLPLDIIENGCGFGLKSMLVEIHLNKKQEQ